MRYTGNNDDYFDDDDDEILDDDDEFEDDDEDEESGSSASSSRSNPFTSRLGDAARPASSSPGNLPGRTTGLGGSSSSIGSRLPGASGQSPRPATPTTPGSSGTSGGSSAPRYGTPSTPSSGAAGTSGNRFGSPSTPSSGSGTPSSGGANPSGNRFGSPSTPSSGSGTPSGGNRFGGSSTTPGSSNYGGSSSTPRFGSSSPSSPSSPSNSAASPARPAGTSTPSSSPAPAKPAEKKDEPKADEKKSGGFGSSLGGLTSRFGGGAKADDKKPASSTPAKPGDKPAETKSGPLGGITSRFGGGAKADDKKDDKKPAASSAASSVGGALTSRLGGLTSRFGGGAKADDKKDDKKPTSGSPPAAAGASGFKPSSTPASASAARPATPTTSSPAASSPSGARPFGAMGGSSVAKPAAPAAKPAAKPEEKKPAGGLGRFLPSFGRSEADKKAAEKKQRVSKAPTVQSGGLTLDNKLDILGVSLVLGSLALFFSSMSSTKGQLTEVINRYLSQAFGWGAVAIPLAMLGVGIWLIARHFGEEAPVVPTTRIIGIVTLFIGILLVLMMIETMNYTVENGRPVRNPYELRLQMKLSWEAYGAGGGWVGAQLYDILVTNFTEAGAFFATVGWIVIGMMFTFSISVAELTVIIISVGRSLGEAVGRRRQQRAAAAVAMTPDQLAALGSSTTPVIAVSKPEPAVLPPPITAPVPALPALETLAALPAGPPPERNIAINIGGRATNAFMGENVSVEAAPPAAAAQAAPPPKPTLTPAPAAAGGSLTSRLRGLVPGSKPAESATATPTAATPVTASAAPAVASTPAKPEEKPATPMGGFRGMFNRNTPSAPAKPEEKPAAASTSPATASTAPSPTVVKPATPIGSPVSTAPAAAPKPVEEPARLGDLLKPAPANGAESAAARPAAASVNNEQFKPPVSTTPATPLRSLLDMDDEDEDDEEDEELAKLANLPPAQPKGTGPLPRQEDPARSRFGVGGFLGRKPDEPAPTGADRQDRLNAIRSGGTVPAPPDRSAVPGATPAAASVTGTTQPAAAQSVNPFAAARDPEKSATPMQPAASTGGGIKPPGTETTAAAPSVTSTTAAAPTGNGERPASPTPAAAQTAAGADAPKSPTPAAPFWKSNNEATKVAEPPKIGMPPPEQKPPAPTYGKPTNPPGVTITPSPGMATTPMPASTAEVRPAPVINTPTPAVPPPPRAGVGVNAPQGVARQRKEWKLPNTSNLLMQGSENDFDRTELLRRAKIIEDTLNSFGAPGKVVEVNTGPVITQFGVEPDYLVTRGGKKNRVKVSAIAQLDKDLQLALGAKAIRIEAPVPGKGYVGIEVPNEVAAMVSLRDVMESREFKRIEGPLAIALGQSVDGKPVAGDLASMPHLLIAGTTGSGKSVCVNAIITSIIIRNPPDRVKFIMVDPKRVELTGYNGIPHLVAPVVVDLERIVGVLKWVTREMDERYKKFSAAGARNIEDYNRHLQGADDPMPYIVVIIDELADLMMMAPDETERVITRIAALARATGIHLVIATQRPSVDVVTGLIKANFPARIAFAVAGGVDSRVILDQPGAERLLGRGDMLYMSGDAPAPLRLQGVYVSDNEINNITRYWKSQMSEGDVAGKPITALVLDNTIADSSRTVTAGSDRQQVQQAFWDQNRAASSVSTGLGNGRDDDDDDDDAGGDQEDELYEEAVEMVRRLDKASVSLLQRRLRIGYTRAARLIDRMEEENIVGPATEGSKPREVIRRKL